MAADIPLGTSQFVTQPGQDTLLSIEFRARRLAAANVKLPEVAGSSMVNGLICQPTLLALPAVIPGHDDSASAVWATASLAPTEIQAQKQRVQHLGVTLRKETLQSTTPRWEYTLTTKPMDK